MRQIMKKLKKKQQNSKQNYKTYTESAMYVCAWIKKVANTL